MSIERDLISKVLRERDITSVSEAGVTPAFFQRPTHQQAFKFILEHQKTYGSTPSMEAFERNFPTYKVSDAEDPISYYVDEICRDHMVYLLEDGLVAATDLFEDGMFEEAKRSLAQCLTQVNQETHRIHAVDLTENPQDRLDRYREYSKTSGALRGISTGFAMLDAATGGMEPGQLFVFVGPPKSGKSTMLMLSSIFANMGFYRPLFIGFEMSNTEQEERHDAIRAGVSHGRLRDGRLTQEDFQALDRMARRLENYPEMVFTADSTSTSTVSDVAALIERYNPDVLYVDGVYMMEDENGEDKGSPRALTNITRSMKRMAQNLKIPVAISTQVLFQKMDRKRGVTTASIGYSSSFGQDADVLIGVESTDDDTVNKVKILDGRNVKRMEIFVKWDWETGEFTELDPGEDEVSDEEAAEKF